MSVVLSIRRMLRAGFLILSVRRGLHRLKRWCLRYIERGTFLRPYGPDMTMLLQADDRVLKDIGLTRGDIRAVVHCDVMARAAAARRNEAIASAEQRKAHSRSGPALVNVPSPLAGEGFSEFQRKRTGEG